MKKILITSMLFIFSVVTAYGGEIIRITNDDIETVYEFVTSQGYVWWFIDAGTDNYIMMLYNGVENIEVGVTNSGVMYNTNRRPILYENNYVYCMSEEIYLFDGQSDVRITNNIYRDYHPTVCNGFILWKAETDGPGTDSELFLYKPGPTLVEIIEAEDMNHHANGAQVGDYWLLWSNGVMSEDVVFPETGNYLFEIIARGSLAYDEGPEMELIIDGVIKDTVYVNTTTPITFDFEVEVTAGSHEFSIGFHNDHYNPSAGLDRNL